MSGKCGERKCKHSHVQSEGVYPEWPSYISKSPKKGSMGLTRCGEYARIKEQFLNLKVKEKAIEAFLGYQERNDNGLVLDPWLNRWPQGQWTGSMCGLNRDGFEEYTSGTPGRNGLAANLPTCFWKTGNLHAEHSATWTRERVAVRRSREGFLATRPARKLNGESLAFEVTAVCSMDKRGVIGWKVMGGHTEGYKKIMLATLRDEGNLISHSYRAQYLWHPAGRRIR